MGSSGASVAYQTYNALIRSASMHAASPLSATASSSAAAVLAGSISATERKSTVGGEPSIDGVAVGGSSAGRVKWEEFPPRHQQDDPEELSESDDSVSSQKNVIQKVIKYLKILAPHVGLNILLLSYIAFGAFVFIFLEADHELNQRKEKVQQVLNIYRMIMNKTAAICMANPAVNEWMVERRMRPLLTILSRTHEYDDRLTREMQLWSDTEDGMPVKWTFAASTLYALTVITSTGYDHVTPSTDPGRIFTVFYGLIGIPLMFITAADIGKFLSDLVIRFYGRLLAVRMWCASVADALRDYIMDSDADSIESRNYRKRQRARQKYMDEEDDDEVDEDGRLQLPIASYFVLVVGYCAIGSLLFNTWERGAIWSFIHGLFFSFNTITTIGMGNICVRNNFYLALTVVYVIIGLAVITASLDLCSSTLKRTFTKLHYFGRKIRGARRGFANVSDDIREAMKIVAALKKTRPSKERITLEDLKHFLEVQEQLLRQPYVPYNVHIFKWIEDAYAQYFDDTSSLHKSASQKGPPPPLNQPNSVANGAGNLNRNDQDSILMF